MTVAVLCCTREEEPRFALWCCCCWCSCCCVAAAAAWQLLLWQIVILISIGRLGTRYLASFWGAAAAKNGAKSSPPILQEIGIAYSAKGQGGTRHLYAYSSACFLDFWVVMMRVEIKATTTIPGGVRVVVWAALRRVCLLWVHGCTDTAMQIICLQVGGVFFNHRPGCITACHGL